MAKKRCIPGFGRSSRCKSGKLLRQALYQDVYAWSPFPPEFNKPILRSKKITPQVECCETCDGKIVDNCVTYVYGGSCIKPVVAAYVVCDYVE